MEDVGARVSALREKSARLAEALTSVEGVSLEELSGLVQHHLERFLAKLERQKVSLTTTPTPSSLFSIPASYFPSKFIVI